MQLYNLTKKELIERIVKLDYELMAAKREVAELEEVIINMGVLSMYRKVKSNWFTRLISYLFVGISFVLAFGIVVNILWAFSQYLSY